MHIYSISDKQGSFEAHAVGKNTRMPHRHSRTPSTSGRPKIRRHESNTSDAESSVSEITNKDDFYIPSASGSQHHVSNSGAPLTPATSIASTPSTMFPPPPIEKPSSRRSSFSGSNAPSSPAHYGRFGRSPSPMPALPAIRSLPSASGSWASVKLYGDESFTNFFRRLNFSPDGGLLLTPAGQFEDPSVIPGSSKSLTANKTDEQPARGRKTRPSVNTADIANPGSASSVYIYSRANFARPPIAQLPGHKKASVAVRFSPILYELRDSVGGTENTNEPKTAILEKGKGGTLDLDVVGTRSSQPALTHDNARLLIHHKRPSLTQSSIASPSPVVAGALNTMMPSPALTPIDVAEEPISKPPTPAPSSLMNTGSIFALPYRMLFAVVTMDTVAIYDTQQAGPVCLLTKLHYDEFTDMSWSADRSIRTLSVLTVPCRSPDGQCLILSSRDGYCTIIVFDEILPAHHTQQQALQLQSIAHHHSVPLTHTTSTTSMSAAPSSPQKRSRHPSLTPVISTEELPAPALIGEKRDAVDEVEAAAAKSDEPPKKKRRVALTRVGDLDP